MDRSEIINVWFVMFLAGLVTYAIRLSFILLFGRMEVPQQVQRALKFVPPAVLSAIIFPEVLVPGGTLNLSPANPRLLAGLLAVLVAWRTKNVLLTLVAGMLALFLLNAILA